MIEERMATRNELRGEVRTDSRSTPVRASGSGTFPITLHLFRNSEGANPEREISAFAPRAGRTLQGAPTN